MKNGRKQVKVTKRGTTPIDGIIGNKIRARRLEMHFSQQQLADALGVSFQQVQKYEKGVNRVGVGRLQQMAQFLETDIRYLMGDLAGDRKKPPTVSRFAKFMATKDGADIVEAMIRIESPALRKSVIQLARTLGGAEANA
ncbi:helix-turn-helix domain-containing protein [Bradyrhizobium sp. 170]|uniref:helix-turn-helix domain-containing protein n=1 Tax=Bradyrhizobium sp. 170 TaxID=2782641 RepID=UPI001FFF137F|nr:helix-turn-helix domain-containing protein [Bradyrhizobium sp. 170]UPK03085.1 helix-turn-helix domain-containing protein [Bradyrhizobium sp. 170]